jgi:hypothetical protein
VVTSARSRLVDLGAVADIAQLAARQSESLRRMSRARSERIADAAVAELDETSAALDSMLLGPLRIGDSGTVIVVPTGVLHTVAWAACPSLRPRPFLIAPSARMWLRDQPPTRTTDGVALLGGPGLTHAAAELRELQKIHAADAALVDPDASVRTAVDAFERHALVHVAAHGEFRADNALFSTLRFADGPLSLFDIERLTSVPDVVVLAACDAGAAAHAGNELIGTTAALLRMGVRNVVAPSVEVSDEAEARFMTDFHRSLVDGLVPSEALVLARRAAFGRGTPIDIAAGAATAASGTCIDPGLHFAGTG